MSERASRSQATTRAVADAVSRTSRGGRQRDRSKLLVVGGVGRRPRARRRRLLPPRRRRGRRRRRPRRRQPAPVAARPAPAEPPRGRRAGPARRASAVFGTDPFKAAASAPRPAAGGRAAAPRRRRRRPRRRTGPRRRRHHPPATHRPATATSTADRRRCRKLPASVTVAPRQQHASTVKVDGETVRQPRAPARSSPTSSRLRLDQRHEPTRSSSARSSSTSWGPSDSTSASILGSTLPWPDRTPGGPPACPGRPSSVEGSAHAALADRGGVARPRPRRGRSRGCRPGSPSPPTTSPTRWPAAGSGYGRGARMAFEQDEVEFLGGVRHGLTHGRPGRHPGRQHRVAQVGDGHGRRPRRRPRSSPGWPATRR